MSTITQRRLDATRSDYYKLKSQAEKLAEALRFCITDEGALALRSHGFALKRLDAITCEVKAALAAWEAGQ